MSDERRTTSAEGGSPATDLLLPFATWRGAPCLQPGPVVKGARCRYLRHLHPASQRWHQGGSSISRNQESRGGHQRGTSERDTRGEPAARGTATLHHRHRGTQMLDICQTDVRPSHENRETTATQLRWPSEGSASSARKCVRKRGAGHLDTAAP